MCHRSGCRCDEGSGGWHSKQRAGGPCPVLDPPLDRDCDRGAPPPAACMFPAVVPGSPQNPDERVNTQGLTELHMACLHGQLDTVKLLVESGRTWINSSDDQGRRPVHVVLSSRSSPNTSTCLRYLLERGADVNVTTDSGTTPLHMAASEGFLDCTEILVQAGADVLARDSSGHTALDLARIWCHRKLARYLKSCMWQSHKKNETWERTLVQGLYNDLLGDMKKMNDLNKKTIREVKLAEWANRKGFPLLRDFSPRVVVSQYHIQCLPSHPSSSDPKHAELQAKPQPGGLQEPTTTTSTKQPPASSSRPWTIFSGLQPEKPPREPDLRDGVTLLRDGGRPRYTTTWDDTPRSAPDLPLDVLRRVLFPRAFPSRIPSPRHFEPQGITEVQRLGYPQGKSASPWTEVAMHLAEVLEPGHY